MLAKHEWKRWMKEWLLRLNTRYKWFKARRDFKVGDIVMVLLKW